MTSHPGSRSFPRVFLALFLLALAPGRVLAQADQGEHIMPDKRLVELRVDGIAFTDIIDFLRDVTGANIAVDWKTLKTAGIEKTTPITLKLRDVKFSKALSLILDNAGGENVRLGYIVDEGVIEISTVEALNKKTIQIAVEMRFIRIPAGNPEVRKHLDPPADAKTPNRVRKNDEVAKLLKTLATDPRTSILTTMRVTCFNAHKATASVGEEHSYISGYRQTGVDFEAVTSTLTSGLSAEAMATVSYDRESVSLRLCPTISRFDGLKDKPWPNAPEGKRLMIQEPIIAVSEVNSFVSLAKEETVILSLPADPGSDMAIIFTASATMYRATEKQK